jgi:hypothetical protein
MDRRIGIGMKIAGSLIILILLSGCWCGVEEKDTSNIPDYFSGCWGKFKGKKTDVNKPENNKQEYNKQEK